MASRYPPRRPPESVESLGEGRLPLGAGSACRGGSFRVCFAFRRLIPAADAGDLGAPVASVSAVPLSGFGPLTVNFDGQTMLLRNGGERAGKVVFELTKQQIRELAQSAEIRADFGRVSFAFVNEHMRLLEQIRIIE